jgi:hypothetical protein
MWAGVDGQVYSFAGEEGAPGFGFVSVGGQAGDCWGSVARDSRFDGVSHEVGFAVAADRNTATTVTLFSANATQTGNGFVDIEPAVSGVPEPSSLTLLGIGSLGLLGYGWRRRKQVAA